MHEWTWKDRILWTIRQFFQWVKWLWDGKPTITYPGFWCVCGAWTQEKFSIPTYESCGESWDALGTCLKCAKLWSKVET